MLKEKKKEIINKTELIVRKVVKLFEYIKTSKGYWNRPKFYKQEFNKALPIAEALYPDYLLLFLFDNTTSYSVFAQDALCIT